ncbi:SseB family protein [Sagittula salina]|uniref:SseB family protein n=1 Tax=Sagittula salina TaxID=2820268 RepID=A0A940MJP1_9RHOB|nr:SseB family protein [Sagittula salina]MBP0482756.1 SseB family protein [Sagittula salina]
MAERTPLDQALEEMESSDAARLAFYDRLASTELFLLLAEEPQGDNITPDLFDVADARFVLTFDREDRLSDFAARPVPYVALSGRALAGMLAGQGIGLALNLGTGTETLLPPESLSWLADTLAQGPQATEGRIENLSAPKGLPDALLTSLDAKLASAAGLADCAFLAQVAYEGGVRSHLIALVGAPEEAEHALAGAVQQALTFSGLEAGALDVLFLAPHDALTARLARHGLRIDLPQPPEPQMKIDRPAPGSNPDKPPILR